MSLNKRGEEVALALREPRIMAFLTALRYGEGTADPDGYRRMFGGELFESFADHPRKAITKQFGGKGKWITSTAAGAYQFLGRTWSECKGLLELPDFSPESQDIAAAFLVRGAGAFPDLRNGNPSSAAVRCAGIWASLPTSPYGQPVVTMERFLAAYNSALAGLEQGAPQSEPIEPTEPVPLPQEPPEPDNTPTTPLEPTMPLPALILPLAAAVIEIFSPLAREKINREMSKHTDKPEIAEQIATGVMQAVKLATGVEDPIQAVAAVKADPELAARAEAAAVVNVDELLPMLDKLAQWEKDSWAAEETSRDAASARARLDSNDQDVFLTRAIVLILLGILVVVSILIGVMVWAKADAGTVGTLVGLLTTMVGAVVSKFGTRYDHRYGSSRSSGAKDVVISELSRRPKTQ